jgi:hypothetical protein
MQKEEMSNKSRNELIFFYKERTLIYIIFGLRELFSHSKEIISSFKEKIYSQSFYSYKQ